MEFSIISLLRQRKIYKATNFKFYGLVIDKSTDTIHNPGQISKLNTQVIKDSIVVAQKQTYKSMTQELNDV